MADVEFDSYRPASRILLIEDNQRLERFVARGSESVGFLVDLSATAEDGDAPLRGVDYDVLILDLGLPDYDGLDLLSGVRQRGVRIPVLILTACDDVSDRVKGLDLGADDCLGQAWCCRSLTARLQRRRRTVTAGVACR